MLDAPNYLNGNLYMTASLQQSMVNYYNFLTAYEDCCGRRDPELERNRPPRSPTTSTNGSAGTV